MSKFSENLKKLRIRNGYTVVELAKKLEISESSYRNYENGRQEPVVTTLYKMANVLHTDFNGLLGGEYVSNSEVSRVLEEVIKDLKDLEREENGKD